MSIPQRRQYVRFAFFKVQAEWRRLPIREREEHKQELAAAIAPFAERFMLRTYSTVGTRGDVEFMLWGASERLEDHHELAATISSTRLGSYLDTPYSYLAMTKRSMYVDAHTHEGQEGSRTEVRPPSTKYLFVYPFVKTRPWYRLSMEERQAIMSEHIRVGHKYPSVRIHTTYSFGLDDQEFVVSFDTDSPGDFLDLVMELRESVSSSYTERDTPIFSCIAMPLTQALDALDGAALAGVIAH
ncbi:MAG TPA: chlorite dismutase family protein [Chloroflexota bacterium]|jgi:chlorite dismutase|nr:chlorite dismutase family protein [Chloroflexota bacterium]